MIIPVASVTAMVYMVSVMVVRVCGEWQKEPGERKRHTNYQIGF